MPALQAVLVIQDRSMPTWLGVIAHYASFTVNGGNNRDVM